MRRRVGVLFSCLVLSLFARTGLSVVTTDLNSTTPTALAQLLAGPGVTVSNVTYRGANVAAGSFTGGTADGIGIESGVILSSGDIAIAAGPNIDDGATGFNEAPGDADLDVIVGKGQSTNDAAVLEFDFVPSSSTVTFRYVFASEEYNEFVGFFNDVFAFYIDGNNVALIPGTGTPVAINTVNLQSNSSFYRNNDPSDLGIPTPFGTEFDGFTTVLTATATLTPNVTHHIKLAIADTDDFALDSAVFLQAASFVSQSNLTIAKTAPETVASGENLTYTITYGNTGNTAATGVVIRDTLPAGTSFVSATGGGTLSEGGVVTWNVGTVAAKTAGLTVSFTVRVDATGGTITNSNYSIQAANQGPRSGAPVTTTVTGGPPCPAIAIAPSTLAAGSVGSSYQQTFTATGGTAPHTFTIISGSPPPGLSLSPAGVLSGTPTATGEFSFTVRALDANECAGSRAYRIEVRSTTGCDALAISPPALLDAFVGVPYERELRGVGGTAPFSFSVTSGSLPAGLSLSSRGAFSGTPAAAGTSTFSVRVVDAAGCVASRTYTLSVGCPPAALSPPELPTGSVGVLYPAVVTVLGGAGPYTFSASGALPAGVTLLPNGAFSGAPAAAGTFTFSVTATGAGGCTVVQSYTLTVCTALTLLPAALPGAVVGASFSQTISPIGGTAPYTFSQTGLPSPLTLSPSGTLSGTPATAGVFTVVVTIADAAGCTGVRTYELRVCPVIQLSPASLPGGAVGVAYHQTISASGGTAPHVFTQAGLPAAITLSPAGALSGTPAAAGTVAFTVTATDASGCAATRSYTIVVTDPPPAIVSAVLSPEGGGFLLTVSGSGFEQGAVVVVDGVSYPATFLSSGLLTVALPSSAVPRTGSITVTVSNPGPAGATSNPAVLTFCEPPAAPRNPTIEPVGNPSGPVTATDFLLVRWLPPASGPAPVAYEFRINGGPPTTVVGATSAVVPPRGDDDPITLHVRAKCNASMAGPEAASPTYSLAPPVADFTFSTARVGSPVVFTDTSSPQATSWLWIFDDGATSTQQSPTHTFTTAGTHRVALIASNGSGSSQAIKDVPVSASTSSGAVVASDRAEFSASGAGRWRLENVALSSGKHVWLSLEAGSGEEAVVYLRFLTDDRLVLERRLSIAGRSVSDAGAYGLEGVYTLEIVASEPIAAVLEQPVAPRPENLRKSR